MNYVKHYLPFATPVTRRARYTMGGDMGGSDALGGGGGDRSPTRGASPTPEATPAKTALPVPSNNGGSDLLDLEAIFGGGPAAAPAGPGAAAGVPGTAAVNGTAAQGGAAAATPAASSGVDLLADVFGASGGLAPSSVGGAVPATATSPAAVAAMAATPATREEDFGGFEVAPSREEKVVVSGVERRWVWQVLAFGRSVEVGGPCSHVSGLGEGARGVPRVASDPCALSAVSMTATVGLLFWLSST